MITFRENVHQSLAARRSITVFVFEFAVAHTCTVNMYAEHVVFNESVIQFHVGYQISKSSLDIALKPTFVNDPPLLTL